MTMGDKQTNKYIKNGQLVKFDTNQLTKLEDDDRQIDLYAFPSDIERIDNWVAFRIHRHKFFQRKDQPLVDALKTIFLPIPSNLSTQYDQNYSSESIGVAGQLGAASGGEVINAFESGTAKGLIDSLADKFKSGQGQEIAKRAALYYGAQAIQEAAPAVGAGFGSLAGVPVLGLIGGIAGGQFLKGAMGGQGKTLNPHMAVLYEGPNFRTHSFNYKFVPKNKLESEQLQSIISQFKYHSSPGFFENASFFDYPEQFDIDFKYPEFLFNIGPSVLKSFEVNYHAEGAPLYFDSDGDKPPASVTISMQFQELFIIDKDGMEQENR